MTQTHTILLTLVSSLLPLGLQASQRQAAQHVSEGIQHFRAQDLDAALKSFNDADLENAENHRIAFNRACVLAAQGDAEKAQELFQQSALDRDPELAAESHYNLGNLAAAQAKSVFRNDPLNASLDARQQGLGRLADAVRRYRDCLDVDAEHQTARHNLELIRVWIKHMQAAWEERDRQQRREESTLPEFLQMILQEQQRIRTETQALAGQTESPRWRQAVMNTDHAQRQLAEEIEPLKSKIEDSLKPPDPAAASPQPPAAPADAAAVAQGIERLKERADQAHRSMQQSADDLAQHAAADAVSDQEDAIDSLREIQIAVSGFPQVLQHAIATQQTLVDAVPEPLAEESAPSVDSAAPLDFPHMSREQAFVARLSQALTLIAQNELDRQPTAPPDAAEDASVTNGQDAAAPSPADMREAYTKAVEHGPTIEALANEATQFLEQQKGPEAKPKQEQALTLLKEISEALGKQQQQQPQQSPDQDPSQQPEPPESQNDNPSQSPPRQDQPQDMSQQETEALLQKVRERQKKHRDLQKHLQRYLRGSRQVERDW